MTPPVLFLQTTFRRESSQEIVHRGNLVDLVGIEPTTSSMPWKRAPSCATGPHCDGDKSILAYLVGIVKRGAAELTVRSPQTILPLYLQIYEPRENAYPEGSRLMKFTLGFSLVLYSVLLAAQADVTSPTKPADSSAPVPYSSVSQVNLLLSQLEQTSQSIQRDLSGLRIEKWKTDTNSKHGSQADVASIQRNLQTALPEIVSTLRKSPDSLPLTFKLYRNVDALYDVFASLTESTGAFGPRDDYQALQNDLNALESSRRMFADRMETLADSKESELSKLRADLQTARAPEKVAAPPKKTVVDDTEPPKPPAKKKPLHKVTKPPASASPTSNAPALPPVTNPAPQ
jgi:hypothetical protein